MRLSPYSRAVPIARDAAAVATFVAHVPNLPRWTRFFLNVGDAGEEGYPVTTQMGPGRSWAEVTRSPGGEEISIFTRFADRQERARVEVVHEGDKANVRFHVALPEVWPEERVRTVLAQLELELATLKQLLEPVESES
jgi:hypothetical protein